MPPMYEIRADYDRHTIVVYQAFNHAIADAALAAGRFVAPFSMRRMTWIKPSFLWLMARSNWARKSGQERILAVTITRAGWESALARSRHLNGHTRYRSTSHSASVRRGDPRAYRPPSVFHSSLAAGDVG